MQLCPRIHFYRATAVAVILMLETRFTGLEKWFNKLEKQYSHAGTKVHQAENTTRFFLQNRKAKNNSCGNIPKNRLNFWRLLGFINVFV